MDLKRLQEETGEWLRRNFPGQLPHQPLLGLVEELGELAHARLKHEQAIRGYDIEKSRHEIEDAIGDIQVFLAGFCNTNGYDLDDIVERVWSEVRTRDWVAYPETGRPPEDGESGADRVIRRIEELYEEEGDRVMDSVEDSIIRLAIREEAER